MLWLGLQYLLFIFLAGCGVLQLAARWNKLAGLSFFRSKFATHTFAVLTIGGGYAWFFFSGNRNTPGLEGAQQFSDFLPGVALALVFTLVLSSLIHRKDIPRPTPPQSDPGLDALKKMNYFAALRQSFRKSPPQRGKEC